MPAPSPRLTLDSLGSGGSWGRPGRAVRFASLRGTRAAQPVVTGYFPQPSLLSPEQPNYSRNRQAFECKIKGEADCALATRGKLRGCQGGGDVASRDGQAVLRAYVNLIQAAREFDEATFGGSELDLGITSSPISFNGTTTATYVCFTISFVVCVVFVCIAGFFTWLGFHTRNMDDSYAVIDLNNQTCHLPQQNEFQWDSFFGLPDESASQTDGSNFKNIYCGMVLGLIFGFLDNFGLFYGLGALDASFYEFGSTIAAGLMALFRHDADEITGTSEMEARERRFEDLNTVTNDLMSGLGNTFSDLLGVALGTAALEIAKAGLGVDPSFWPLDLLAIVLGCLLGCFLPVLIKHQRLLGGVNRNDRLANLAYWNISFLFCAVFTAGIPHEAGIYISCAFLSMNILTLVVLFGWAACVGDAHKKMLKEAYSSKLPCRTPKLTRAETAPLQGF